MTALEILIAARDWLAVGPERWCQGAYWLDSAGSKTCEARACAACALGAIRIAARDGAYAGEAEGALASAAGARGIGGWNDSLPPGRAGWEQVIEALDRAIEAEKARGDASH